MFQPQVDGSTGSPTGLEALLRWRHTRGAGPAGEFIPIAEERHHQSFGGPAGADHGLRAIQAVAGQDIHPRISVNVSPGSLPIRGGSNRLTTPSPAPVSRRTISISKSPSRCSLATRRT